MIKLITDKNKWLQAFQITFENGYTIAVGIGSGHHCQNRINATHNNPVKDYSIDCETAIIKPNGKYLPYNRENTQTYVFANELADTIAYVKSLEPNNHGRVSKN